MKNLLTVDFLQFNFTCWLRISNIDPDPAWRFESGSGSATLGTVLNQAGTSTSTIFMLSLRFYRTFFSSSSIQYQNITGDTCNLDPIHRYCIIYKFGQRVLEISYFFLRDTAARCQTLLETRLQIFVYFNFYKTVSVSLLAYSTTSSSPKKYMDKSQNF